MFGLQLFHTLRHNSHIRNNQWKRRVKGANTSHLVLEQNVRKSATIGQTHITKKEYKNYVFVSLLAMNPLKPEFLLNNI
jgi:hypothetical protein